MNICSKIEKKIFIFFCALIASLSAPLAADEITVSVQCNSQEITIALPIRVFDSNNQELPDLDTTDWNGMFVIQNSETYQAPFRMFFKESRGSTCGSYPVIQTSATEAFVNLPYNPTTLPCSCSKF